VSTPIVLRRLSQPGCRQEIQAIIPLFTLTLAYNGQIFTGKIGKNQCRRLPFEMAGCMTF
jgi:hypothetical protein